MQSGDRGERGGSWEARGRCSSSAVCNERRKESTMNKVAMCLAAGVGFTACGGMKAGVEETEQPLLAQKVLLPFYTDWFSSSPWHKGKLARDHEQSFSSLLPLGLELSLVLLHLRHASPG